MEKSKLKQDRRAKPSASRQREPKHRDDVAEDSAPALEAVRKAYEFLAAQGVSETPYTDMTIRWLTSEDNEVSKIEIEQFHALNEENLRLFKRHNHIALEELSNISDERRQIVTQDLLDHVPSFEFIVTPFEMSGFLAMKNLPFEPIAKPVSDAVCVIAEMLRDGLANRLRHEVELADKTVGLKANDKSQFATIPPKKTESISSLAFRSIWIRGENDEGLVVLNQGLLVAGFIDDAGRWRGPLEVIGELLRGLVPYVPPNPKGRNALCCELLVLQKNGEFAYVKSSQIVNAFKRAISPRSEVTEIIRRVKVHYSSQE